MFDLSDPSAPSLSSVVYLLAGDFVRDGMDHAAEPVVELILRRDRDAAVGAFVDLVLGGDRCGATGSEPERFMGSAGRRL